MTVWGVGYGFRFGGGWPVGISPGISGKQAFWFVWDDCGDCGFLFMLEGGVDIGLQVETPITVELNLELMKGAEILSFGGGCVKDLEGWAGGVDVGAAIVGDVDLGGDITSHGMLLVTVGVGLETGAGVNGGAHVTRKWFIPLNVQNCPCELGWYERAFGMMFPGASVVYLGKALYKLATQ